MADYEDTYYDPTDRFYDLAKCKCNGTGLICYEPGNPMALELCGCDEAEEEDGE